MGKLTSYVTDDSACEGPGHILDGSLGFVSTVEYEATPVSLFRCYNATHNDHLMTTDRSECNGTNGYVVEFGGPVGYVAD